MLLSGTEWLSLVGPLEWLGHGAIEVVDEGEHLVLQIFDRAEVAAPQELAHQDAQPDLDLVQPRRVLGCVVEHDGVAGVAQKRRARGSRPKHYTHVLDAKICSAACALSDVAHQARRAMDIEVIDHEMPLRGAWITLDGAPNMLDEVRLCAGRSTGRAEDLTSGHVEIDDERARAVAFVFELVPRHFARTRRQVWCQSLTCLNVGQLVGADRPLADVGTFTSGAIDGAHVSDLDVPIGVGGGRKPGAYAMRMQVGRFSTTARHGAARCVAGWRRIRQPCSDADLV